MVAIPSITGLHSYPNRSYDALRAKSQSLLLQVFIHTYCGCVVHFTNLCRNPFYYRSSFILKIVLVTCKFQRSQSLLLQVFIHTRKQKQILLYLMSQSLLLQVFIHTNQIGYCIIEGIRRNPFYYRSSFILTHVFCPTSYYSVAIPSITGLHSYNKFIIKFKFI